MWWCNFLTVEILLSYSQEFNQHDNTRLHVFAYKACRTPSSAQSPDKLAADRKEKLAAEAAEAAAAANCRHFYLNSPPTASCVYYNML
jgi:hypothetical protein